MLRHAKYRALTDFLKEKQRHYDGLLPTAALYRRKSLPISPKRLTPVKIVCPTGGGERISRWPQFYAAQVRLATNRRQASWQAMTFRLKTEATEVRFSTELPRASLTQAQR